MIKDPSDPIPYLIGATVGSASAQFGFLHGFVGFAENLVGFAIGTVIVYLIRWWIRARRPA